LTANGWRRYAAALSLLWAAAGGSAFCATADVKAIVAKSVEANNADFKAAPQYCYRERDKTPDSDKTHDVYMIAGSPYERLVAVNGKPISTEEAAKEQQKLEQARRERKAESPQQRRERVAKYEKDRQRDNAMMDQLTKAFTFKLMGQRKARGFTVYVLKATPRAGYKPPNMETQVLTGMQGEMWIDTKTYKWVRVTAQVIHPVSIEGFLAEVEPGTQFELEKMPVGNGIWMASHFAMKSHAKVLYMFNRASQEDDTFSNYRKTSE
jgi:DNA-binding protein H-NS